MIKTTLLILSVCIALSNLARELDIKSTLSQSAKNDTNTSKDVFGRPNAISGDEFSRRIGRDMEASEKSTMRAFNAPLAATGFSYKN